MTQGLYLSATTTGADGPGLCLALVDALGRAGHRVGLLRPVHATDSPDTDPVIRLLGTGLGLEPARWRAGLSQRRAHQLLSTGEHHQLGAAALAAYAELAGHCDVVVVSGVDPQAFAAAGAGFEIDTRLANDLACSVLAVLPAAHQEQLTGQLLGSLGHRLAAAGCDVLAILLDGPAPQHQPAPQQDPERPVYHLDTPAPDQAQDPAQRAAAACHRWRQGVDEEQLWELLARERRLPCTPQRFRHQLVTRARTVARRIVLAEGTEPRILRAAEIVLRERLCELTLLGALPEVLAAARAAGVQLEPDGQALTVLDPSESPLREDFAQEYARVRAHKGVSLDQARQRMLAVAYFATMMVHRGLAHGMVSGAVHTTAETIRPALEIIRTGAGVGTVSSVFFMLLPDRVLVYGDCAVNPAPDEEQLAQIAAACAVTAEQFGIDPKVAMLSYSTGGSGAGPAVERVRAATELLRRRVPQLAVEGPVQYDAAVDASVAATKLPGSTVAGRANVLVFPDLGAGNIAYKAVQQSAGAVAVGPVLQGLRRPVNDLSRGCTVEDIVNTVAITAVQAQP